MPGADGHPVHPKGVDDDPHDGEEPEQHALCGARHGLADRHPVGEAGDEGGHGEPDEAREMGLHADGAEQDEHGDQGQGRDECGQTERSGHRFKLLDEHGRLPGLWVAKLLCPQQTQVNEWDEGDSVKGKPKSESGRRPGCLVGSGSVVR